MITSTCWLSILTAFCTDCNPGVFGTDLALNQPKNALMVRISNGVVNYTGVSPGSIAILDCDEGYKPISGLNRSTCMFDGQWSEEILSCELTTDVSTMSSQSPYGVCMVQLFSLRLS